MYILLVGDDGKLIKDLCVDDGTMLFIWDGFEICAILYNNRKHFNPLGNPNVFK